MLTVKWANSVVGPKDGTLTNNTTPGQSKPGSNCNEGVIQYISLTIKWFSFISWTHVKGVLPFCRDGISEFYSVLFVLDRSIWNDINVMKNEHLTLPPSRAFRDDITILVRSQITADCLLQRYYDLFTWARMKAKPKKVEAYR